LPDFNNDEPALFFCNKRCVDEYIKFAKDFIYQGKDYTSRRIISSEHKLIEAKSTAYTNMNNSKPINTKNQNRDYGNIIMIPFNNKESILTEFNQQRIHVPPKSLKSWENLDSCGRVISNIDNKSEVQDIEKCIMRMTGKGACNRLYVVGYDLSETKNKGILIVNKTNVSNKDDIDKYEKIGEKMWEKELKEETNLYKLYQKQMEKINKKQGVIRRYQWIGESPTLKN
jgi:hypothetical protein